MRGFPAGLLVVGGLVMVPLADAGLWSQRHLFDNESFTDLSVDVLYEPAVSDALASRLTDEVMTHAGLSGDLRVVVEAAVDAVGRTPEFEQIFRTTVSAMHKQLERGDPQLVVDFNKALPVIRERAASIDASVAAEIPDSGLPVITVIREEDAPPVWQVVDIVRRASLVFPLATLVLLAAGVAISWRRARLMIVIGIALVVIALAMALLVGIGRDLLTDVVGTDVELEAFESGYDVVTGGFVAQTALFAMAGGLVGAAGAALMWRQKRNRRPLSWA
ncbi:MAG: hypothetical protein FJW86_09465 [Actinobacteria bacterium]|nr:hypothetical protein [Actinomycetota bacterium]